MGSTKIGVAFALLVSSAAFAGTPDLVGGWSGQGVSLLPDGSKATSQITLCIEKQDGGLFAGSAISINTYLSDGSTQLQPVCGTGHISTDKRVTAAFTPPPGYAEIPLMALFDGKWTGRDISGVVRDPSDGATSEIWFSRDPSVVCPLTLPVVPPFVSEIHYDNEGTDAGEAIEVTGPAGADLAGYSLVLYNGNGGAPYATISLTGTFPDLMGGYGVLVFPTGQLQNGSPDGFALVDGDGYVVELLSYEGTFIAVGGPADGMTSTDIGTSEDNPVPPVGYSLQLIGGIWQEPAPNSFGSLNEPMFSTFSCVQ